MKFHHFFILKTNFSKQNLIFQQKKRVQDKMINSIAFEREMITLLEDDESETKLCLSTSDRREFHNNET